MKTLLYKLDENKNAVPCAAKEWVTFEGDIQQRRVANDYIGPYRVSTVFLGVDHSCGHDSPELFETMVFVNGGSADIHCRRYSTWTQAEEGHSQTLTSLSKQLNDEEREANEQL